MDRRYSERSAEASSSGSVSASRVSGARGGRCCTWSAPSSAAGLAGGWPGPASASSGRPGPASASSGCLVAASAFAGCRARNWYVCRRASRARTCSADGRVSSTEPVLLGLKLSRRFDPVRLISPSRQLRMAARMSVSRSPGGRAESVSWHPASSIQAGPCQHQTASADSGPAPKPDTRAARPPGLLTQNKRQHRQTEWRCRSNSWVSSLAPRITRATGCPRPGGGALSSSMAPPPRKATRCRPPRVCIWIVKEFELFPDRG